MRALLLSLTVLATMACNGDGRGSGITDDGDPPIPRGRGDCGETNPVIDQVTAVAGEPNWFETTRGRECLSTVLISVVPSDVDGDLTYYKMDVWWDAVVDGRVLNEGEFQRIEGTIAGDDCEVTSVPGINMSLGIAGDPPFETEVEFGVIIEDDSGNRSNEDVTTVVSVVTPPPAQPGDCG